MAVSYDNFGSKLDPAADAMAFADKVEKKLDEALLWGKLECKIHYVTCEFDSEYKCMGTEFESDFLKLTRRELLERYIHGGWKDVTCRKNGSYLVFRVVKGV